MRLIRAVFLFLAVCLPTTWTLAHAADEGAAGSGGDMKDSKPKKKSKKKKDTGGAAGAPGDADKK